MNKCFADPWKVLTIDAWPLSVGFLALCSFEFVSVHPSSAPSTFLLIAMEIIALQQEFRLTILIIIVVRCAISYHFYNLKSVKNTHGGVLLLQDPACNFTKSNTPLWVFFMFFKLYSGTKSRTVPQIFWKLSAFGME